MTELPSPQARRLRPPSWRDPRLLVGVLLVLGSVVLGSRVVAAADDTVAVWAAVGPLVAGDPVTPERLTAVDVRLGEASSAYLPAADPPPDGAVLLRPVGDGELLPRAALGSAEEIQRRAVGIPVAGALPDGVVKGALVDVWVSPPDPERAGEFGEPELLAAAAEVAGVATGGSGFAASGSTTVQVLLAEAELRAALRSLAADAEIALVLVPGSTPR